jgi:hypothetical protein
VIYLIGGGVLALAIFIALLPKIVRESRIFAKAREDYARSRGTHHARQLREALKKHEAALRPLVSERLRTSGELDDLGRREAAELERSLTIALINGSFLDIPGIGGKLKARIMQSCFVGTLGSLLRAHQVRGVGQEKSFAIRSWVHQMQRSFPQRLTKDFNGKDAVRQKYAARHEKLTEQLEAINSKIGDRERVISEARTHLKPLESVSVSAFRGALRGNHKTAEKVAKHALGAFAEWESIPAWFVAVLREPNET